MAEGAKMLQFPGEIGDRKIYVIKKGEKEPKDHPALEISFSKQDSVHWVSYEQKFRVIRLEPTGDKADCAPKHPFYREFPEQVVTGPKYAYQINTGPAKIDAINHMYKAHFEFEDGTLYDPHIRINP
jgi:hypothetical protein